MLTALTPLLPFGTLRLAVDVSTLKLGTVTVTAIAVVLLNVPEVPVTVIG
jgi:hypothetical protein